MPLGKALCNRCSAPGACCKRFTLTRDGYSEGAVLESEAADTPEKRALVANAWARGKGFPFKVVEEERGVHDGKPFYAYLFGCPELKADGRCGIYRKRPQVCRDFKAGSGPLCVMHEEKK